MKKITGYLGPPGTFSYKAAEKVSQETKPYQNLEDIVESVEKREITWGVLPLENSLEGAVTETMDLLLEIQNSLIIKEIILPIRYILLAKQNQDINDIETVISHSQALAQCRELFREYPHLKTEATTSTAGAANEINNKDRYAALSPASSCKNYELNILWEGPKRQYNNETRFVVLGHNPPQPSGNDRTSIAFGIQDSPGTLYKALEVFSELEINLTRIESRPSKKKLGEYVFYVDFEGHKDEDRASKGLKEVEYNANFLKILGSYQKDYSSLENNKTSS